MLGAGRAKPEPARAGPAVVLLALLALTTLLAPAAASVGDRMGSYRNCVDECVDISQDNPIVVPLHRQLLLWNQESECSYECQHVVTDQLVAEGRPVVQFHGKWPFYRFLGMQEPLSVLFSLLNLAAHYNGGRRILRVVPREHPIRPYYVLFSRLSVVSWALSALFHTRDFSLTEKLDYFGAGAGVLYGLWYAVIRLMGWEDNTRVDPAGQLGNKLSARRFKAALGPDGKSIEDGFMAKPYADRPGAAAEPASVVVWWTRACVAMYAAHVAYLGLWSWDYSYNMVANVVIGMAGNATWITYGLRRLRFIQTVRERMRVGEAAKRSDGPAGKGRFGYRGLVDEWWPLWPIGIVIMISSAMSLELFDFAPVYRWLDAHALWHLATVVPAMWWYEFLVRDAEWDVRLGLVPGV